MTDSAVGAALRGAEDRSGQEIACLESEADH
jgi:hypothetical protein